MLASNAGESCRFVKHLATIKRQAVSIQAGLAGRGWPSLEQRREIVKATSMMYILHNIVIVLRSQIAFFPFIWGKEKGSGTSNSKFLCRPAPKLTS